MKPKKPNYIHEIKFVCVHCGRERMVEVHESMRVQPGSMIQPYAGGGNWGRCLFCKRAGLKATEAPPVKKKESVGWRKR